MAKQENADSPGRSRVESKRAKVNVVTTPLKKTGTQDKKSKFRDINEDDDGYHPYCDGPERPCQFERDPWS